MTRRAMTLAGLALVAAPSLLAGQQKIVSQVRVSSFYERYAFDPGLAFTKVTELTVPVGIDLSLGRFLSASLSSGYVKADLTSADSTQLPDQTLSGALETEVRLSMNLIPGRLIAVAAGEIPTGIQSVSDPELSVLGAISSDVIGFAVPTLGTGGSVSGGLVGAVPLGRMALGLGATYQHPLTYQPIVGQTAELKPGAEVRTRAGLEGALGRTTYLRVAGVFALRQKDVLADTTQPGVGARIIGYLELNQGFGNVQLTVYGFDVYRGSPELSGTPLGAVALPRGNLMAGGFQLALPVSRTLTITPRGEYRNSRQAPGNWQDTSVPPDGTLDAYVEGPLSKAGTSFRYGLDVRQRFTRQFSLLLSGSGIAGSVVQAGTDIGLSGYRAGLLLDFTP